MGNQSLIRRKSEFNYFNKEIQSVFWTKTKKTSFCKSIRACTAVPMDVPRHSANKFAPGAEHQPAALRASLIQKELNRENHSHAKI